MTLTVLLTGYPIIDELGLLDGTGVETGYPPYGVETGAMLEETAPHRSLEIPNCVLYWYAPVMSSMSWRP